MLIEITSYSVEKGIVSIEAIDCSEENLQRLERVRDDGIPKELTFIFDTSSKNDFTYLYNWLHRQKVVKEQNPKTWGEALNSVRGIVTTISGKYLELV